MTDPSFFFQVEELSARIEELERLYYGEVHDGETKATAEDGSRLHTERPAWDAIAALEVKNWC